MEIFKVRNFDSLEGVPANALSNLSRFQAAMSKPVEQKANSNLAAITALKELFEDLSTKWRLSEDNAPLANPHDGVDTASTSNNDHFHSQLNLH
jgi:hypothetical protein